MSNWKEQLNQISEKLKKGEKNDSSTQGDSSFRDRSNSGRRGNVNLPDIRKKIINKNLTKGGKIMIPAQGIWDDFKKIDADDKLNDYQKLSLKLEKIVKVILNCRTNTTKIMTKLEIPLDTIEKQKEKKE